MNYLKILFYKKNLEYSKVNGRYDTSQIDYIRDSTLASTTYSSYQVASVIHYTYFCWMGT